MQPTVLVEIVYRKVIPILFALGYASCLDRVEELGGLVFIYTTESSHFLKSDYIIINSKEEEQFFEKY